MNFTGPDGIRLPARRGNMLRCGVSALAVCTMAAAAPAYAQAADTQTTDSLKAPVLVAAAQTTEQTKPVSTTTSPEQAPAPGGAIIVTGIRQSLRSAQQIKRNSDT